MPLAVHRIGLVVDRNFGSRIIELARHFHTWVVESPENAPVIQQFWKSELDAQLNPLRGGVTSFVADEEETPEAICSRITGDLEDHHGEFAEEPPWSEIEVFGVKLNPALQEAFGEIGAASFESTDDGFICRRTTRR